MIERSILAVVYVGSVVLANVLTETYGLVPIGLGMSVTAGTFAAGVTLLARNIGQDVNGRRVIVALMVLGVVLSWWLASPALALASGVAFALSETADMAVYTPLRRHGWAKAALAAALVGAVVDTVAFLWIAGFPIWQALPGQLLVKVGISAIAVALAGGARALFRQPVHPEGA